VAGEVARMTGAQTALRKLADGHAGGSFSNRMRARRFELFEGLTASLPRPLRIIDVGGTNDFWVKRGWAGRDDVEITLVNLKPQEQEHPNIVPAVGDATNLSEYEDGSFDVAFSNSVIEHLFTLEAQTAMAREVVRVGRAYWVQTPNFWFPMEPHFLVPGWQWLPERARVSLIQKRACGWRGPCPEREDARATVREVRLMRRRELSRLFPRAAVEAERFGGLAKSFVVHGGFPRPERAANGLPRLPRHPRDTASSAA
jgi:Methyltransferase domain